MGCILSNRGDEFDLDNATSIGRQHFDFQIIVGQGGFGKVNAVIRRRTSPPEWYAIKTMYKRQIINKGSRGLAMLFNERQLLSEMDSKYIINMHHCFQDSEACYIVMDLMLGGDLRYHMTRRDPMNEKEARFYIAAAIQSICAVHARLIIHRDIKPDNFVLDRFGFPRLTDFGISVKLSEEVSHCYLSSGTRPYMAPEMLTKSRRHSYPADFWMIGVCLYELIAGRRPFRDRLSKKLVQWIEARAEAKEYEVEIPTEFLIRYPTSLNVSAGCDDILAHLLDIRPWKRWTTKNIDDIRHHQFFAGFDWDALGAFDHYRIPPPIIPDVSQANCDTVKNNLIETLVGEDEFEPLNDEEQAQFQGYEYQVDIVKPESKDVDTAEKPPCEISEVPISEPTAERPP